VDLVLDLSLLSVDGLSVTSDCLEIWSKDSVELLDDVASRL